MSDQLPLPAFRYTTLPPVAVNEDALLRFDEGMDLRLAEFEQRFWIPRQHAAVPVHTRRHQPPRKPR